MASDNAIGYGLGWELETHPLAGQPTRMAGHGSKEDFIGGTTYFMTFPERGLVIAVMANISFADTKSIALNIAQAFAETAAKSGGPVSAFRVSLSKRHQKNRPWETRVPVSISP